MYSYSYPLKVIPNSGQRETLKDMLGEFFFKYSMLISLFVNFSSFVTLFHFPGEAYWFFGSLFANFSLLFILYIWQEKSWFLIFSSQPFHLTGEAVLPEEYGGTNGTIDEHR